VSDEVGGTGRDGDVMHVNSVAREIFDRIADRWALLIIAALGEAGGHAPLRFTELHARVEGISHKMLTRTLRGLERDGVVDRFAYACVPPRVEYRLTVAGRELLATVTGICAWTRDHLAVIEAARERFDAARPGAGRG
jgi:DNA-binding HxlR family transcriptional regulator